MSVKEICEIVVSIISLVLTAIGLILIVFGWIVPYKQKIKLERKKQKAEQNFQKLKWEKEMIDNQISLFYGPISALLYEHHVIRDKVFRMIGRHYIFDDDHETLDSLPLNEQKIWVHYTDFYKLPINLRIAEIIKKNYHLIYNSDLNLSLRIFMDYIVGLELLDNQKRNKVPNDYQYRYFFNFPHEFEEYINETLELLMKKQSKIIWELQEDETS